MSEQPQSPSEERLFYLEEHAIEIEPITATGWVLDIGGGGEGVIGQLMGERVVAIDPLRHELQDSAPGPLKIVMDARDLKFLDASFQTVTSFFTLMFVRTRADQEKIFTEVMRVLQPGGQFLVWDVKTPARPDDPRQDVYVIRLRIHLPQTEINTAYGQLWPAEKRTTAYYAALAKAAGLVVDEAQDNGQTFFLRLVKPYPMSDGLQAAFE